MVYIGISWVLFQNTRTSRHDLMSQPVKIHTQCDSSKIYGAGKTESLAMPTSTTMQPTLSSGIRPGS